MGMTPRQSPQAGSATSSSKLTPKGPRWWHFGRHRSTGSLSGSSDGRANRGGAQTLHAADSDAQLGDEVEISRPAFSFKKGKVKGRSRSVPSIASDEPPRPPPLETESSWHEVDRAEMPRENDDSPTKLRQTAMFIGSKGYCLLHPDGSRSYATCRQVLDQVKDELDTLGYVKSDAPQQEQPNRANHGVNIKRADLDAIRDALASGDFSEEVAARKLLACVGPPIHYAVRRVVDTGGGLQRELFAAHASRMLSVSRENRDFRRSRLGTAFNAGRIQQLVSPVGGGVSKTGDAGVAAAAQSTDVPTATFTHEGGGGGTGKENQDCFFVAQPSSEVAIFGVLDGHGKKYGQLAALAAAESLRDHLCAQSDALLSDARATLVAAFAAAHEAVRQAMLEENPQMRCVRGNAPDGEFLLDYEQTGSGGVWDAADGGTTAVVAVLLRGSTLVVASVGDSPALLLGRSSTGSPRHRELIDEHSATHAAEFERICAFATKQNCAGSKLRFVYDCPDGEMIDIFKQEDGHAVVDEEASRRADEHDCMVKTSRGDLVTCVVIPEESVVLPSPRGECEKKEAATTPELSAAEVVLVDEQLIAMTRSLGDFYAHHHGVSSEPEVLELPLSSLTDGEMAMPHLLLASDGITDLWEYDDIADAVVPPIEEANLSRLTLETEFHMFCEARPDAEQRHEDTQRVIFFKKLKSFGPLSGFIICAVTF